MTGPEHYRKAEALIELSGDERAAASCEDEPAVAAHRRWQSEQAVALAQVHATLAMTAATAELDAFGDTVTGRTTAASTAWAGVLS